LSGSSQTQRDEPEQGQELGDEPEQGQELGDEPEQGQQSSVINNLICSVSITVLVGSSETTVTGLFFLFDTVASGITSTRFVSVDSFDSLASPSFPGIELSTT
jgi:hypothetical protein